MNNQIITPDQISLQENPQIDSQQNQNSTLNDTKSKQINKITVDVKSLAPLFVMSRVIKLDNINLIRIYTCIVEIKYYLYIPV